MWHVTNTHIPHHTHPTLQKKLKISSPVYNVVFSLQVSRSTNKMKSVFLPENVLFFIFNDTLLQIYWVLFLKNKHEGQRQDMLFSWMTKKFLMKADEFHENCCFCAKVFVTKRQFALRFLAILPLLM